jgi:hypothetical protein
MIRDQEVLEMSLQVRILLTLAALVLLPVYSAVASGEVGAFQFTINPASGPQSTAITVTGQGALAGLPVQVMLAVNGETGDGALTVVQVDPDAGGNFSAVVVVPANTSDGRYAVRAEQRDIQGTLLRYYWAGFTVGPILNPTTGGLRETSLALAAVLAALLVGMMAFQGMRLALRRP